MDNVESPRFPPEIEVQIFQKVLQYSPKNVLNIILVARRVYEWMIPEAFKVVVFSPDRRIPLKGYTPASVERYGVHVHHLYFSRARPHPTPNVPQCDLITKFLTTCPNLTDVVLGFDMELETIVSIGSQPNITRLSTPSSRLLFFLARNWNFYATDPSKSAFPHITHLRLTLGIPEDAMALARHFPSLTHFAVGPMNQHPKLYETDLQSILDWCMNLRLCVVWKEGELGPDPEWAEFEEWDEKLLFLKASLMRDWEDSARGLGLDIWEFGEGILRQRREIGKRG